MIKDNVNSPSHYTDGKIEVIDFIEDKNLNYHRGNAIKYISRAGKKDKNKETEDLRKAIWYLNREIDRISPKNDKNKKEIENKNRIKIYICSKYKGDVKANVRNALKFCKAICKLGHIPVAPHLYFTRFLDDNIDEERQLGLELGLELLSDCDELWVFGDDISEGMLQEMNFAKFINIPVRYVGGKF